MAWTQADVDTLQRAIGSGTRKVTYADGSGVEYQNVGEMMTALRMIEGAIAAANSSGARTSRRIIVGRVGRL